MAMGIEASRGIVKQAFENVFRSINISTEARYQRLRLKTTTKERFADYVTRSVGVFPLFGTTHQAFVETAYVRVGLSSRLERERYRTTGAIIQALREQRFGDVPDAERHAAGKALIDVVDQTQDAVAIIGSPGSGKTTALRHLAVMLAKGVPVRGKRLIPFFLSVRDLAADNESVEDSVIRFLKSLQITEASAVYSALLRAGDAAILLDGVDEARREVQVSLLREITKLREDFPDVVICISGRPYTLNLGLPGFQKWETLPLSRDERVALVRTWYAAVDQVKGEQLLRDCEANPGLLDLGSSPLLLCIVCALYYNDLKIPDEPDELYARTVEGLLGAWDAFRNIARDTPLRDFSVRRRVLLVSWLAAFMYEAGKIVFTTGDIDGSRALAKFAEANRGPALPADDVLQSLYNDFGILIERAPNVFSFSHLTFQEYLTAQYIVDNRREVTLVARRNDDNWREIVRLVAKMLPNANIYMASLSEATDLANSEELAILSSAWAMRPICDRSQVVQSMKRLAQRVLSELRQLNCSYEFHDGTLIATLRRDYRRAHVSVPLHHPKHAEVIYELERKRRQIEGAVAVLCNLPIILQIFRATGVSMSDLKLEDPAPLNFFAWSYPLGAVELRNW